MQATNDIFLGYTQSAGHDYFVRQLYDMKGSADLSRISATYLERYAALCGAVLAQAYKTNAIPFRPRWWMIHALIGAVMLSLLPTTIWFATSAGRGVSPLGAESPVPSRS